MTNIATGWTECMASSMREQILVVGAFEQIARRTGEGPKRLKSDRFKLRIDAKLGMHASIVSYRHQLVSKLRLATGCADDL